jgi:hypothetical protein
VSPASVATIGFLHTAAVHVETFRPLVAEIAPGVLDEHVVDPSLLADARARGITDGLRGRLAGHLEALSGSGAGAIVCTCSSIGGEAERLGGGVTASVLRVDRPMAEEAVRSGGRVAIVAALESTLEPTRALLEQCADGVDVELTVSPCLDAWTLFEEGDVDGYLAAVAAHVRHVATEADVVVLAQASMAPVAALVADVDLPVLSSPRPAVEAAARLVGPRRHDGLT